MTQTSLAQSDVNGVKLLRLAGTLNLPGVERIHPAFSEAVEESPRVVVDLSGVDVINTPGIGMILAAARDKKHSGGHFVVTGANAMVAQALRLCRLDMVLAIVPDVNEALEQVKLA